MSKYNFDLNMEQNDTNPKIIKLIKEKSNVLEFGPANGRLTRYLQEKKNCTVDIVERDYDSGTEASIFADISCIGEVDGDIEKYLWCEKLNSRKYNYILFADVLEHLQSPEKVISRCRDFLKEEGLIIVSIPNIAHNAIIANLLNDKFEYNQTGLLDSTHIRFFTYNSFMAMVESIGLGCNLVDIVCHEFDETEFELNKENMKGYVRKALVDHKYGSVYQYIFAIYSKTPKRNLLFSPKKIENISPKFYFIKCFWMEKDDHEFSEEKSKVVWIDPNKNRFELDIKEARSIKRLRIDPLNYNSLIKIKSLCLKNQDGEIECSYITNGIELDDNLYLYLDKDNAQIIVDDVCVNIEKVIFSAQFYLCSKELIDILSKILKVLKEKEERYTRLENENQNLLNNAVMQNQRLEKAIMCANQQKTENNDLLNKFECLQETMNEQSARMLEVEKENEKLRDYKNSIEGLLTWKILRFLKIIRLKN